MSLRMGLSSLLALSVLLSGRGIADAEPPVQTELGRKVDEKIQRATQGGFWGVIGVARGGTIDIAKGYGFADMAQQPNDADTIFELASVSKQVTATAILKLEQQGKLKTSDTLAKFWPKIPEDKQDMTVQHLLNHTSGLDGSLGVSYRSTLDRAAYVQHILQKKRTHFPGDHFNYSNVGYALLAAIVEEVTGGTFESYCIEHLFKPAGLSRTGFIADKRFLQDKNVAARLGDVPSQSAVNWHWGWGYKGMGGVVSTLNDMLVWDAALRGDKILNKAQRKKLFTPAESNYACGWKVETTSKGKRKATHSGGVQGFGIWYTRLLDENAVIVLMTNNRRDLHSLVGILEDAIDPRPKVTATIDVASETLSKSNAAEFGKDCSFDVITASGKKIIALMHGGKAKARISIPAGFEKKVVSDLRRAAAARKHDDKGGPPAMDGGIYLSAYGGTKTMELSEQLGIMILPEYRGRGPNGPIVDKRVVFVLNDSKTRNWPVMVKMNVAATEKLIEALE